MLYHQKSLAQVNFGSCARNSSQTLRPCTRRLDCFQKWTSANSRLYHPLPTIPCWAGNKPVRYVDWAGQVTAGNTGTIDAFLPVATKRFSAGVEDPRSDSVKPTTLMTAVRAMLMGKT